jgi:hypothetical protein
MNGEQFSNFTFNPENNFAAGTYTLIQTDNANGISANALGTLVTGTITGTMGTSYNATLQVNNIAGNDDLQLVVVASVPEPSTWALLIVGGLVLAVGIKRRAKLLSTEA